MSIDKKAEKFWDRMAKQFEKRSGRTEEPDFKRIKGFLRVSDSVLDCGCATGVITCALAGDVKEILGLDISSAMIEVARKRADEMEIENIDFLKGTIDDETLKPRSFDVIIAFNILHFYMDTDRVFLRFNELLKPEGRVIISTSCIGERSFANTLQVVFFTLMNRIGVLPYMKFYKLSEFTGSILRSDFHIIETIKLKGSSHYFIAARKA